MKRKQKNIVLGSATVLVLVVMSFFEKQVGSRLTTGAAAYTALGYEVLALAVSFGASIGWVNRVSLEKFGLGWILPALIGGVIGTFFHGKGGSESMDSADGAGKQSSYTKTADESETDGHRSAV